MRRYVAYALILVAILTIVVWAVSRFVQPILPTQVNDGVVFFFAALLSVVGVTAGLKDIIELFQLFAEKTKLSLEPLAHKPTPINQTPTKAINTWDNSSNTVAGFEKPGLPLKVDSKYYIERVGDDVCRSELRRQGATVVIKAVQQMGKSSLLNQLVKFVQYNNKIVIVLDFKLLDDTELRDSKKFYKDFCRWITVELGLTDVVEQFWDKKSRRSNENICTQYIQQHILNVLNRPLVLV